MDAIYSVQNKFKQERGLSKVQALHNENYKPHGTKSYVRFLHKYSFEPTKDGPYVRADRTKQEGSVLESLKAAVGSRTKKGRILIKKASPAADAQHGDVTAEDIQNDLLYLCKISTGTPTQTLTVDFDTGSADFWVFSSALVSTQKNGHNVFDPKQSKTYKALPGKSWKIQYGDGSTASGDCGTDTLNIGGLSVKNQTVETAKKLSQQFIDNTGDGLLGLAFSSINTVEDGDVADPQPTPVENMMKQSDVPKEAALFTSALYSWRNAEHDKPFYTFGYIDQDLVNESGEEIHWVDIDKSNGLWAFSSESVSINGESIFTSSNTAIADTGTTLTLMPDAVVDALYAHIPGATYDWSSQGYIFPITVKLDDLPEFKVAVGGKEFVMQREDLGFAPTDDGRNWYGGVQSRGSLPFNIYGDTFLRSVYAIWDQGNNRFGAVPKLEPTQNLKTPAGNWREQWWRQDSSHQHRDSSDRSHGTNQRSY